tara:strand:- start:1156 stop:1281 length:126 start_codon:yes stop_codon:yes gene_type:complete
MRKYELYLKLAKPFQKVGNYLMNKHVKALREIQKKEGKRRL